MLINAIENGKHYLINNIIKFKFYNKDDTPLIC